MTFSLVIASQDEDRAKWTLGTFRGFREEFESIVMVGYPNILDAYREGQARAKHDLVAYVHNDVTPLTHAFEATFRRAFLTFPDASWIGVGGCTRPLACGCVYHDPWSAVDSIVIGRRNYESRIGSLADAIPVLSTKEPRYSIVNLARKVALLDAGLLVTMRKDWTFEVTSRENFLGAYDADISYEATERKRNLYVIPFPVIHWGCDDQDEIVLKRDAMFLDGRTAETMKRWAAFTVPCRYGSVEKSCIAFDRPKPQTIFAHSVPSNAAFGMPGGL